VENHTEASRRSCQVPDGNLQVASLQAHRQAIEASGTWGADRECEVLAGIVICRNDSADGL